MDELLPLHQNKDLQKINNNFQVMDYFLCRPAKLKKINCGSHLTVCICLPFLPQHNIPQSTLSDE